MIKEDAVQWLGNRGHMFEVSDIIKCKKIGIYLFIQFKEYKEDVELYDLTDMYGECQEVFSSKEFKWNKDYMRKCITGEI
tara:strand:+ start:473 stop:712 length:240 start_codon:yes stop_codon:yes gene_type:complete